MLATDKAAELAEYQAVLSSPFFAGQTNSSRFLKYVCDRFFAGIHHVTEVEVAVEALGRRSDFDPQQDSIVRVEAHRVRKRLHDYYESEGAGHPIRLVLPQGSYLPQFVPASEARTAPENEAPGAIPRLAATRPSPLPMPSPIKRTAIPLAALVLAGLVGAGLILIFHNRGKTQSPPVAVSTAPTPFAAVGSPEVLIMAGSSAKSYTDQLGHIWSADRYFDGGEPWPVTYRRILRTSDPQLFLSARQGQEFGYDIPLKPGDYELRLFFAETFYGEDNSEGGGESSRMFDVTANGAPLLTNFDPLSDAGGSNTADVRVFAGISPASDGKLHLKFRNHYILKGVAFVNAIELTRTEGKTMLPVRWVAGDSAIEDQAGRLWVSDQSVEGGRRRAHRDQVEGTNDPELYQSERYGNFTYAIPVATDTTYTLTLYFAEEWFGVGDNGGPQPWIGRRVFDVYCNGTYLLHDFDIYKESGGALKALTRTFHGLKPNHQGKLYLSFVPNQDYAAITAIEVVPETQ
ncbi:MAG: malectin domain-containing carbohydrate-binding protein [Terracidiphilus sp.]